MARLSTGNKINEQKCLAQLIQEFLEELQHANYSQHTLRAYASDLAQLLQGTSARIEDVSVESLRELWHSMNLCAASTRARKQASVARFLSWASRHDYLASNPMDKVERVKLQSPLPRSIGRENAERVLKVIPKEQQRDRLLFGLLLETGLRIGEALALYVEDITLTADDERLSIKGKGGKPRTVLLDDPRLVRQLRVYLGQTGYKHGPLFRAEKNGKGGQLRYQSIQERWATYCHQAGIVCTLHQLRHTHATELVNDGVSLATIRKRLGHKNLQTTLRYAEQSDAAADTEMRQWRRQRG